MLAVVYQHANQNEDDVVMTTMRITGILLALLLSSLSVNAFPEEAADMEARIKKQMSSPDRHDWDLRRDSPRKPFETFQFLGLKKDMVALDVGAYAGYTSEMLAAAVGPGGKVYMQNTQEVIEEYANGYYDRTISERLANNRLPNVALHVAEYEDLGLHNEVDVVFLGNLIHDFYYRDGEENALRFLASIREALKPGGILGVMDHVGDANNHNGSLHRIDPDLARGLLTRAGFVIEAESNLFKNAKDDHSLMVYDETIYLQTDRFLFRAINPD
jgi:predicted methyltransferase